MACVPEVAHVAVSLACEKFNLIIILQIKFNFLFVIVNKILFTTYKVLQIKAVIFAGVNKFKIIFFCGDMWY